MSRHTSARKAINAINAVKAIMKQLKDTVKFTTIAYLGKCLTTLFETIHQHAPRLTNALRKECNALEGECRALYDQTYRRVFLTALSTLIQQVAMLKRHRNMFDFDTYIARYEAIIARFYQHYDDYKVDTEADDTEALDLENRFNRACDLVMHDINVIIGL